MTVEPGNENDPASQAAAAPEKADRESRLTPSRELFRFPGLMAIALYMFVLAGYIVLGVAHGYVRPAYLIFSAVFFAAAGGLLMMFRWAWNLALAGVVLLVALFMYRFTAQRDSGSMMQALLNLVMFLYLVRPEVRARLR
jgi:lysylphosphatidylglycerol synthetase-like protein (DUF2156 family)